MALAREHLQHGRAVMEHCPTAEHIADMWTKQLGPGYNVFWSRIMDSWGLFLSCILRFVVIFNSVCSVLADLWLSHWVQVVTTQSQDLI
jgi:hypothetical protein